MTRTDRLYALVEELRAVAPRPRSARWLADRFGVSARTIERDLSALQLSGVPIRAEPGRTGGYCLDTAHTVAPLGFTVDEALTVMIALGALATSPFRDSATSALRKVVAVTDDRNLSETADLASRIHLLGDENPTGAPTATAARPSGTSNPWASSTIAHAGIRPEHRHHVVASGSPDEQVGPDGATGRTIMELRRSRARRATSAPAPSTARRLR